MSSDPHLAALRRAGLVSASQSPFGDTFQLVTDGQPGRSIAAHDMTQGPVEVVLENGGSARIEQLSFAVLKSALPQSLPSRALIRARRHTWTIETVSGEDPAEISWKFTASQR